MASADAFPTKIKVNPFSTRSLLTSQTPSTARKSALTTATSLFAQGEALADDGREIGRALVLVAGDKESTDGVIELFEETYRFTVMAAPIHRAWRRCANLLRRVRDPSTFAMRRLQSTECAHRDAAAAAERRRSDTDIAHCNQMRSESLNAATQSLSNVLWMKCARITKKNTAVS